MEIAQIRQLRVTARATPGATPRATPKMMYYCACPTQTAARLTALPSIPDLPPAMQQGFMDECPLMLAAAYLLV